jgi:Spy/CpxP family protein refolding chaperone
MKSIFAGIFIVFASMTTISQETTPNMTAQERAAKQTERMAKELNLTAEQKEKITVINESLVTKNEAIRANSTMTEEAKRESIKTNNDSRRVQYSNVFTPEQLVKFDEMQKAQKEKRKEIKRVERPMKSE